MQPKDERMIAHFQDIRFCHGVSQLSFRNQRPLFECFDGINHLSVFLLRQEHFPKGTLSKHFQDLKRIECHLFVLQSV